MEVDYNSLNFSNAVTGCSKMKISILMGLSAVSLVETEATVSNLSVRMRNFLAKQQPRPQGLLLVQNGGRRNP